MNIKTHLACFLLLAVCFPGSLLAKDWIDVTDAYIVNPRFDGDDISTGWSGTAFGSAGPRENAEHYSHTFDTYQDITGLKPGTYRLSLNAFYRCGEAQADYDIFKADPESSLYAQLYASTSSQDYFTGITHVSSAALENSLGGGANEVWSGGTGWGGWGGNGTRYYVPTNMEAAYLWFEAGYYQNVVSDIVVGNDGKLRIGIRKSENINADWVCLDNWKLEYYGDMTPATGVSLDARKLTLQYGQTGQLHATVLPEDATVKALVWESTDEGVAKVDGDGLITATGKGTCTIYVYIRGNEDVFASCEVTVERSDISSGTLIINEIQSKNVDMFIDPSYNFGGWIELYNPTSEAINIGGCYVSDDPEDLMKYHMPDDLGTVPAFGYKNIWFDHNTRYGLAYRQVNMKLDCDGGIICVSDPDGRLIASQEFPEGIGRASWARVTDGSDEWGWTSKPTPEASNNGSPFCTEQLPAPSVDVNGKMFESGEKFYVTVDVPKGAQLRYTTDGTTPTLTNGELSTGKKFFITKTVTYRWRLFQTGKLPSPVTTRSYIVRDRNYTLPVVSIVTDQQNITGNEYGVDVRGAGNGRSGNGERNKVNWNMDWDRPVSFEYIEQHPKENSEGYFQQEADLSISGGWSRRQSPRSFKIKASKTYDLNSLDYRFFDELPYNKNKALLFRNGGNDGHAQERLKDAAIDEIVRTSGLACDLQLVNPCHIFINGRYRGMQNMRQPSNKHLAYSLYGIDTDEIDAFEISVDSGYCQMAGTRDAFEEWYELAQTADQEDSWKRLQELVDIDEYCNYQAVQLNLQNWDWPHNNHKGYRERRDGGKFRMVLFDVDNVFEQNIGNPFQRFENDQRYTFYPIFEWNDKKLTLEVEPVTIFLGMLKNPTFRKKFIDTYCLVNGSVFEPKRCAAIIDELASYIKPAMALEGYGNNVTNRANTMKGNFSATRQNNAVNYIKSYSRMGLSKVTPQQVSLSSNIEEGKVLINDMYVPTGKFKGGLFYPITFRAETPAGYKFAGWKTSASMEIAQSIIQMGDSWNYYNNGSLDGRDWKSESTDVNWSEGIAPFGYGNSGTYMSSNSKTKVGSSSDKKLCVYFQKSFTLDETPAKDDIFRFSYVVDDGFRLHINGQDVGGYHCEKGDGYAVNTESHNSGWYEGNEPKEDFIEIPATYFKKGLNVIAIDLHNCNSTSSDLFFDASLEQISSNTEDAEYVSTDPVFEMPSSGNFDLEAIFEPEDDPEVLLASGCVPVKINEVSAGNTVNVNDYFKKDDWIELYNNTDEDIDIAGMYLSDKAKNPLKYQVPADMEGLNTLIPARGHLVVWASKRDIIGTDIHTNFKLDNEDDAMVILTAADKTWSDTLRYNMHDGQESFGRYPDGGQKVYHMTTPSIASPNVLSMYSTLAYTYVYTGVGDIPEKDGIKEELMAGNIESVDFINTHGMSMGHDKSTLRPGIYIVRYHLSDGTVVSRKQVIK